MKPNPKMLFGNIFDDRNITPNYLARFTDDVIAKLIQNNIANAFNSVLVPLQNSNCKHKKTSPNLRKRYVKS